MVSNQFYLNSAKRTSAYKLQLTYAIDLREFSPFPAT